MTAAYDAAWQHLRSHRPTLTDDQVRSLKRKLAQIILASACNGNRDVVRLKEIALRGVWDDCSIGWECWFHTFFPLPFWPRRLAKSSDRTAS